MVHRLCPKTVTPMRTATRGLSTVRVPSASSDFQIPPPDTEGEIDPRASGAVGQEEARGPCDGDPWSWMWS